MSVSARVRRRTLLKPIPETVPVKFYFCRRAHAVEFQAELHRLGVADAVFGQTFTGGAERWMVTTDYRALAHGAAIGEWLSEAVERWKPSEDKLGAEARRT